MRTPIKVFEPSRQIADKRVTIVLSNQVGSTTVNNGFTRGDTVGDASYLADTLGVTVIAADRPCSGTKIPLASRKDKLNRDASAEFKQVHANIRAIIAARGIQRTIFTGRSLGGFGALALGTFGATEVKVFEPGAMYNQDLSDGKKHYKAYLKRQKELLEGPNDDLIRPHDSDQVGLAGIRRGITIGRAIVADKYYYQHILASDLGLRDASFIAKYYPDTTLSLLFAEESLVAPSNDISGIYQRLQKDRWVPNNRIIAPVEVSRVPNTVHSSFDNREFFASQLVDSVQNQSDLANSVS